MVIKRSKPAFFLVLVVLALVISMVVFFSVFFNTFTNFSVMESSASLSSLSLSVTLESGEVKSGENLIATIKIINLDLSEAEDVIVEYSLLNKETNKEVSKSVETVALQTSLALVKTIPIPESLPKGNYAIEVIVKSNGEEKSASSSFIVGKEGFGLKYEWFIIGIGIFVSLSLVYIIYLLSRRRV